MVMAMLVAFYLLVIMFAYLIFFIEGELVPKCCIKRTFFTVNRLAKNSGGQMKLKLNWNHFILCVCLSADCVSTNVGHLSKI